MAAPLSRPAARVIAVSLELIVAERPRLGADGVYVTVLEPSSSSGPHHTIECLDGEVVEGMNVKGWWGSYATREIPAAIDALPRGPERVRRVHEWYETRRAEALAIASAALGRPVSPDEL